MGKTNYAEIETSTILENVMCNTFHFLGMFLHLVTNFGLDTRKRLKNILYKPMDSYDLHQIFRVFLREKKDTDPVCFFYWLIC